MNMSLKNLGAFVITFLVKHFLVNASLSHVISTIWYVAQHSSVPSKGKDKKLEAPQHRARKKVILANVMHTCSVQNKYEY